MKTPVSTNRGAPIRERRGASLRVAPEFLLCAALLASALAMTGGGKSFPSQTRPRPEGFVPRVQPADAATEAGFGHFYNMKYAAAVADFESALASHPGNPGAVNHLLEAVLFGELHREGKLDAQLYLTNEFVAINATPIDPKVAERIHRLTERALEIENARLAAKPGDANILYARSVTRGLRATNEALLQKAWFTALRSGLGAYDDSKKVLALEPADTDARLIVGIYNYVVGSLPWPVKVAALLATMRGSKTKGLAMIRQAAEGAGEASIDARTTLALFLAREHDDDQSLAQMRWLYAAFPRNFLYGLAEADLLKILGRLPDAAAAYRRLVELGMQGAFPDEQVGLAAIGLGDTLRLRRDWRGAAEAYERVAALPHPDREIAAQAHLDAGEIYDVLGKRSLAVKNYEQTIMETNNPYLAQQAGRRLKKAYY